MTCYFINCSIHVFVYVHLYDCIPVYMCVHTYTYTNTHTHTHTHIYAATLEYTILQTQYMASKPVTVYRHGAELSSCYSLMCAVISLLFFHESSPQCGSVWSCIIILENET